MASGLEVEIKLAVGDLPEVLRRLERAGARRETERRFEDNRVFDFPDGRLRDREVMFRLRRFGDRWTTTLKERVPDQGDYKIRREYESEVSDGEAMLDVIRGLGMEPVYRYQKYRSTFRDGETVITVDELPIGNYLELEGAQEAIDALAARLGFSREDYINADYRTLHEQMLEQQGGGKDPAEMVFPGRTPS
jgi:adenylate cyclase class 2